MKISIACGGTGGHIFPGLATAEALRLKGNDVTLWLAGRAVESLSVDGWDGPVNSVKACGMPTGVSFRSFFSALSLFRAFLSCRRTMKKNPPDVLLAMGSYASVGPVLAARSLKIPIVLHESNAVPGRANTFLARYASVVALGFESASSYFPNNQVRVTGFPLRAMFDNKVSADLVDPDIFTVLVMGGSQGAHKLNEVVTDAICKIHSSGTAIQVIHLVGQKDLEMVKRQYERVGVPHFATNFLKDMTSAYLSADMAVSRAGSASCAELAAFGVPAVLIPLPSAARNHQLANARSLASSGGVDVLEEKNLTPERLGEYIKGYMTNPEKMDVMKSALDKLAVRSATSVLADLVESVG